VLASGRSRYLRDDGTWLSNSTGELLLPGQTTGINAFMLPESTVNAFRTCDIGLDENFVDHCLIICARNASCLLANPFWHLAQIDMWLDSNGFILADSGYNRQTICFHPNHKAFFTPVYIFYIYAWVLLSLGLSP
jgi:hypothetical protein